MSPSTHPIRVIASSLDSHGNLEDENAKTNNNPKPKVSKSGSSSGSSGIYDSSVQGRNFLGIRGGGNPGNANVNAGNANVNVNAGNSKSGIIKSPSSIFIILAKFLILTCFIT